MTWTNPRTWTTGQKVLASEMNTDVRDNMLALKNPPTASFVADESSNYTTSSTSFVDVDPTAGKFSLTIVTSGGDVMVGFTGTVRSLTSTNRFSKLNINVDGVDVVGDDGILVAATTDSDEVPMSFVWLVRDLAPGSHTFKLRWKTSGSTITLFAGAGTADLDIHPQFWVREVS